MGVLEALTIGAAVASAAGTAVSAVGTANASEADAARLETNATLARAKADETDTRMREEQSGTIANIRAVRAAAGVSLDSPTQDAIETEERRRSNRDIATQRANAQSEEEAMRAAASQKRRGAQMSLFAGGLGAASSLAGGISKYKSSRTV